MTIDRFSSQVPEHFVPTRCLLQPQHLVRVLQGIQQVRHPPRTDRQRLARSTRRLRAQVQLALPGRQPLQRR